MRETRLSFEYGRSDGARKVKKKKKKKKEKPIVLLVGVKDELKGQFRLESCSSVVRKIDLACPI